MTHNIYTGIGSRQTPLHIMIEMTTIASILGFSHYILRSGGAGGADSAFEVGCDRVNGHKEIYLPWKNFKDSKSLLYTIHPWAFELAEKFHPNWKACSAGAKKLHARNAHQLFGYHKQPTDFVICWTPGGRIEGGTGMAIRIAREFDLLVYNLAVPNQYQTLIKRLKPLAVAYATAHNINHNQQEVTPS